MNRPGTPNRISVLLTTLLLVVASVGLMWWIRGAATHAPAPADPASEEAREKEREAALEGDQETEAEREAEREGEADSPEREEEERREHAREEGLRRYAGGEGGGELEEEEDAVLQRDRWFYAMRTSGNPDFTVADASVARSKAAQTVLKLRQDAARDVQPGAGEVTGGSASNAAGRTAGQPGGPATVAQAPLPAGGFGARWEGVGPDPIHWGDKAMAGRVSVLAVRSTAPYTVYLGAAQGGLWVSSTLTSRWMPLDDPFMTPAMGAIVLAPSNEDIIYVGTGEGNLSYESYFGDGVYKSTDAGATWRRMGGDLFTQVSISKIAVHPTDPEHLYVATVRGSNGARRQRAANPTPYGILESTDGGTTWKQLIGTTDQRKGATDLVIDPLQPNILYATFWSQGVVKSVDGGKTWQPAMNGFPKNADYANPDNPNYPSRFSIALGHASRAVSATLYAGFGWVDTTGRAQPPTVWKSVDEGASWVETNRQNVANYCASQCWYDNVLIVDPSNPDIAYVMGQWDYARGSGGIYRTMDGGKNWVDIGYGMHPDFHGFAVRADDPSKVYVGNDGGVWFSANRGGRLEAGQPNTAATWVNLNGTIQAGTGAVLARTGLQIGQFTSIGQDPVDPERFFGGTQDNGTLVRLAGSDAWMDVPGGDGGQVLVDPENPGLVYGTQYGISPYRWENARGEGDDVVTGIDAGIDGADRAAFYIPWAIDPEFTSRLYLGTFRIWRSDDRGEHWKAVSPDVTARCLNRDVSPSFHECVITAVGSTAGGQAVYSGSGDGRIFLTTNAYSDQPVWRRVDKSPLPTRPVVSFAVDRSNYRVAYAAYVGFGAATPTQPGHVFKTVDGGETWANVSGDLPDVPVNWLVQDATDPATLYVATDVGPMVTTDGGGHWVPLGTGMPLVAAWQLDLNPFTRQLVVGTHGRGAYRIRDTQHPRPALRVRAFATDLPIGPGSDVTLSLKVRNTGNASADAVRLRSPLPANTAFVAAEQGGTLVGGQVTWDGLTVGPGASVTRTFTLRINADAALKPGAVVTYDGLTASAPDVPAVFGSPLDLLIAPPAAVTMTAETATDGLRPGQTITYLVGVKNLGYKPSAFNVGVLDNSWPTTLWDAGFGQEVEGTPVIAPGASAMVGVKVAIPARVAQDASDTARVVAASSLQAGVAATLTLKTLAVTDPILLVDQDGNDPDVQGRYRAALFGTGHAYDVWDLAEAAKLPMRYLGAHQVAMWFTGASYGGPLKPYEAGLATYLDQGGRLFLSGWDVLLGATDFTPFVQNRLHVRPDGTTRLNAGTTSVKGAPGNPVTEPIGELAIDARFLGNRNDSDQLDLLPGGTPAFLDAAGKTDAVWVEQGASRLIFMAFPFEAAGTPATRASALSRILTGLGLPGRTRTFLPVLLKTPDGRPW